MTLEPAEFIRRFLMHVLPKGFHRIRHYGLLANGERAVAPKVSASCKRETPFGAAIISPLKAPARCSIWATSNLRSHRKYRTRHFGSKWPTDRPGFS
jgi:hypothetical protein